MMSWLCIFLVLLLSLSLLLLKLFFTFLIYKCDHRMYHYNEFSLANRFSYQKLFWVNFWVGKLKTACHRCRFGCTRLGITRYANDYYAQKISGCCTYYIVGNKAKGRISKRVFQENKENKIWRALFSWNIHFEICPFALLPTIYEISPKLDKCSGKPGSYCFPVSAVIPAIKDFDYIDK